MLKYLWLQYSVVMDNDKYPSWRDALFSNDTVANIRCGIKYIIWHGGYLLIAIVGAIFFALYKFVDLLQRGSDTTPVKSARSKVDNDKAKMGARYIFGTALVVYAAAMLAWVLYTVVTFVLKYPGLALAGAIVAALIFATLLAGAAYGGPYISKVLHRTAEGATSTANRAGKKAVQTPGIRRVYGECPVSMNMAPKWYDRIFSEDEP